MRRIPVTYLEEGMEAARNIYHSRGTLLVASGIRLTSTQIIRLQDLGVTAVYIVDNLTPELEIDDVVADETRRQAVQTVRNLWDKATKGTLPRSVLHDGLTAVINRLIGDILSRRSLLINLADLRTLDDYTFAHSVNVSVLSLLTGLELGYSRSELFALGMGAILHDIGKVQVPLTILNKPSGLDQAELRLVQQHPTFGRDIIGGIAAVSRLAVLVAYQHHERFQGQGYPEGLKTKEIHDYARIVAVADVYDAMTSDRVYRLGHPGHEVYEHLAGAGDYLFDHRTVKAFLSRVAAYPAGQVVELGDGTVGVIAGTDRNFSARPRVRLVFDSEGRYLREDKQLELNLAELPSVVIRRVVPEQEVRSLCQRVKSKTQDPGTHPERRP